MVSLHHNTSHHCARANDKGKNCRPGQPAGAQRSFCVAHNVLCLPHHQTHLKGRPCPGCEKSRIAEKKIKDEAAAVKAEAEVAARKEAKAIKEGKKAKAKAAKEAAKAAGLNWVGRVLG
ncbi:hypothetical protein MMC17_003146 [Xylographa soralifera]|nr:hypothetical protein [Xylographa soralifera]